MVTVAQEKICKVTGSTFSIYEEDVLLLEKICPVINGVKYPIPLPTLSPNERLRRRLSHGNYLSLHKGKSSKSGKNIVSMYPIESPYVVYSQDEWWGDDWEPLEYGREIDFVHPFFEQFHKLSLACPQFCLNNAYTEFVNSEYVNGCGQAKDCYLISNSTYTERCLYAFGVLRSMDLVNSSYVYDSENIFHSFHVRKSFNTHYSFDIENCRDSRYIFHCINCQNLLGCIKLKNSSYQILNKPCTQSEFEDTLSKLKTDTVFRKEFEKKVRELIAKIGIEPSIIARSENSTGDFLHDSKNVHDSYHGEDIENCGFVRNTYEGIKDSLDIDAWGSNTTLSYDSIAVGRNVSNIYWCDIVWDNCSYVFYSKSCINCSFCFGCTGLRGKKYCILNKQYSKEEWEVLVGRLIEHMMETGEWGEFMDARYSPFAYNESHAGLVLPLSHEEVERRDLVWTEREEKMEGIERTIPAHLLPENIYDIPDDILNWAIVCERTSKPFRIMKIELEFYRKHGLPIPRKHPIERIKDRFEWDKRNFIFD